MRWAKRRTEVRRELARREHVRVSRLVGPLLAGRLLVGPLLTGRWLARVLLTGRRLARVLQQQAVVVILGRYGFT
jgi:hypothetical protein